MYNILYMGSTISMTCCSSEEILQTEYDKSDAPPIYAYPDEYLDQVNFPRSISETTRIPLENKKINKTL